MSVIQILDSSKSNRAIYLVASAVLCAAAFTSLGISIELSLDSLTLYTISVSGLALVLWSSKMDIFIVERIGLWRLWNSPDTREIQLDMASILLFVRPWEESLQEATTIEGTLSDEYKRIVRSQEFSEQVSTFHQIFWIILLATPSFYLAWSFLPEAGLLWIPVAFGLTSVVVAFLWLRNLSILPRIRAYTLTIWLHEVISSGLQRREVMRPAYPSDNKEVLETISAMTREAMDLVLRKDWPGFERNSKNIQLLVGSAIPASRSITDLENYFRLFEWVISNNKAPWNVNIQLDRALRNASIQVSDSMSVYHAFSAAELPGNEPKIVDLLAGIAAQITDLNSFIEPPLDLLALFDSESVQLLSDKSYLTLVYLPFTVQNFEKPSLSFRIHEKKEWIIYLSQSLIEAAEYDHFEMKDTLALILSWGVNFFLIEDYMGAEAGKVLWEMDLDMKGLANVKQRYRSLLDATIAPVAEYLKDRNVSEVEPRLAALEAKQDPKALYRFLKLIRDRLPRSYGHPEPVSNPQTIGDLIDNTLLRLQELMDEEE
ncbi:MAG: hypothetical protein ACFFER_12080 [Candidatus Thorarchaeota archaeon]